MALNATTGIDPEIDRFVVKLASNNQVINMNAVWPRFDGGALVGANPDWQYFKKVDAAQPPIDHRFTLGTEYGFALASQTPADGLPVGTYGATYTVVKRSLPELIDQIESAFQEQVRIQFPNTQNPSTLILAAKAIKKRQDGIVLTSDEEATLDLVASTGDSVSLLASRRQELIDSATAEEDYDITVWPTP